MELSKVLAVILALTSYALMSTMDATLQYLTNIENLPVPENILIRMVRHL